MWEKGKLDILKVSWMDFSEHNSCSSSRPTGGSDPYLPRYPITPSACLVVQQIFMFPPERTFCRRLQMFPFKLCDKYMLTVTDIVYGPPALFCLIGSLIDGLWHAAFDIIYNYLFLYVIIQWRGRTCRWNSHSAHDGWASSVVMLAWVLLEELQCKSQKAQNE